jgi:hyperosmotically inducible protein
MDPKKTRQIIALGGMAAVVAVGAVMFTRGSHSARSVSETAVPPPVAQTADIAPAAMPPMVAAPAAVAALPEVSAPVTRDDSAGAGGAARSMRTVLGLTSASGRPLARTKSSAGANIGSGAPGVSSEGIAPETVANRVARLTSTDVLAPELISGSSAADDAKAGTSAVLTASDSQITTDVKTAIARDLAVKDLNIEVSTTDGVVALTGSVASQGAIDQAKDVAGKVKDVKRVDTSALILASL